jgi:hypothetical protein
VTRKMAHKPDTLLEGVPLRVLIRDGLEFIAACVVIVVLLGLMSVRG